MTSNDIKRLGRKELIDIIYEMKKNEQVLEEQLAYANARLEERDLCLSNAGSIAEAALAVNGVMIAAQAAADDYLAAVRKVHENADAVLEQAQRDAERIVGNAEARAAQIVRDAEAQADEMLAQADQAAREKWQGVQRNVDALLKSREELLSLLAQG